MQISRGADIERRDINDMSPLMWAAIEGHTSVAKVLLKAGRFNWQVAIIYIIDVNKVEIVLCFRLQFAEKFGLRAENNCFLLLYFKTYMLRHIAI